MLDELQAFLDVMESLVEDGAVVSLTLSEQAFKLLVNEILNGKESKVLYDDLGGQEPDFMMFGNVEIYKDIDSDNILNKLKKPENLQ